VGDAVAVPTVGPAVAVVEAAVAPGRAELVDRSSRPRPEESGGREGAPAVGPALVVAVAPGKASPVPPPMSPAPASAPVSTPAPELASAPVAAPGAPAPRGPVSAGTPGLPGAEEGEEACAGDEYVLTITPLEGEVARLTLEHIAADGSVETLELEGDLEDARSLVLQLSAEGGCIEVEVLPAGDWEGTEGSAPVLPPPVPAP
jgi:hypothetical protein